MGKKPSLILLPPPEKLFAKHQIQSLAQLTISVELPVTTVLTLYCLPALLLTKDQSPLVLTPVESNFNFIPVEFIQVAVVLLGESTMLSQLLVMEIKIAWTFGLLKTHGELDGAWTGIF